MYSTAIIWEAVFPRDLGARAQTAKAQSVIVPFVTLAAQETVDDEDEETPNYEEKAQEIVQSILQDVVNTVAGGNI